MSNACGLCGVDQIYMPLAIDVNGSGLSATENRVRRCNDHVSFVTCPFKAVPVEQITLDNLSPIGTQTVRLPRVAGHYTDALARRQKPPRDGPPKKAGAPYDQVHELL